jgi:hypothetical protein
VPTPAASPGEQAFGQVRKVELCAIKGAVKLSPRKFANAERQHWLSSSLNVEVTQALVRFSSVLVAEKHSIVSIPAGTFHERAPPA